jgi:hypothetical protein
MQFDWFSATCYTVAAWLRSSPMQGSHHLVLERSTKSEGCMTQGNAEATFEVICALPTCSQRFFKWGPSDTQQYCSRRCARAAALLNPDAKPRRPAPNRKGVPQGSKPWVVQSNLIRWALRQQKQTQEELGGPAEQACGLKRNKRGS